MPEGGGLLSVEGEIICASARECSFFCVAKDVSRRIVQGLLYPKEHGLLKKANPARSGGFPPPDFVLTRREDSSLEISTSTGRAKPDAFTKMQGKAPTRRPQIVERIAVEPQNCSEYSTHSL